MLILFFLVGAKVANYCVLRKDNLSQVWDLHFLADNSNSNGSLSATQDCVF
tara:strand:+ start:1636 stop:1788 length:153 start_codon:yes stop_codon:yes gene_type:complete